MRTQLDKVQSELEEWKVRAENATKENTELHNQLDNSLAKLEELQQWESLEAELQKSEGARAIALQQIVKGNFYLHFMLPTAKY